MNIYRNKNKKQMNFEEIYIFPLKLIYGKVFSKDNTMAFDFAKVYLNDNGFFLSDESEEKVVNVLNGSNDKINFNLNLTYKNGTIFHDEKEFIIIRGWGYLTGTGGLNLPEETAAKMQDDFAEFIIEKLNSSVI